ncbi:MAG: TIGR00153 family protein [Chlamydiales bacterium]|nr:TIGR00153 family protein [Chlamydiales bacterium]
MLTIAKLFGKSPFGHLQNHMHKVTACMKKLEDLFRLLVEEKFQDIEDTVIQLSKLEHEADLCKNDIRNNLPKSLYLPVDRSQFLEILSIQDSLADKAEEIGNLMLLKPVKSFPKELQSSFTEFVNKNMEAFWEARNIIKELTELIESSFGGQEAEKVKEMVDKTAYIEYESDCLKRQVLKTFFAIADKLPYPSFYLWMRLIEEIGAVSHIAEKLAHRIRQMIET